MKLLRDDQLSLGSQSQCEKHDSIHRHWISPPASSPLSFHSVPHITACSSSCVSPSSPPAEKVSVPMGWDTLPRGLLTTANIISMAPYQFLDLAHTILPAKNPPLSFPFICHQPFNIQLALPPVSGVTSRQHPTRTPVLLKSCSDDCPHLCVCTQFPRLPNQFLKYRNYVYHRHAFASSVTCTLYV